MARIRDWFMPVEPQAAFHLAVTDRGVTGHLDFRLDERRWRWKAWALVPDPSGRGLYRDGSSSDFGWALRDVERAMDDLVVSLRG
jgi:hypothetical protein